MMQLNTEVKFLQKRNPYWSSYVCFAMSCVGRRMSEMAISKGFNTYVNKGDYAEPEREEIIAYLLKLTNESRPPEETSNSSLKTPINTDAEKQNFAPA